MTSLNSDIPKIPNPLQQASTVQDASQQAGYNPGTIEADFERRLQNLEQKRANLNTDITGLFEVVSAVPSGTPKDVYDQVKIYTNGTTYRLYWYDYNAHTWRYATGT